MSHSGINFNQKLIHSNHVHTNHTITTTSLEYQNSIRSEHFLQYNIYMFRYSTVHLLVQIYCNTKDNITIKPNE